MKKELTIHFKGEKVSYSISTDEAKVIEDGVIDWFLKGESNFYKLDFDKGFTLLNRDQIVYINVLEKDT